MPLQKISTLHSNHVNQETRIEREEENREVCKEEC